MEKNTIKVFTLCSGYDSQMMAMERLSKDYGFDTELVGWSEIDDNAIKAHNAVFPQYKDRNLGDMSKIDWSKVEDFDLLTYSTPCTDISAQGRQEGLTEGSGTRSSLLWYTEECIKAKKPKYLLMENVKHLVSKKFKADFEKWLRVLENNGYKNYWKVLDSADYGIPQHRERVFVVSVLDDDKEYQFPNPIKLEKSAKDLLEPLDEKWLYNPTYLHDFHRYEVKEYKDYSMLKIGNVHKSDHNGGNVYDVTDMIAKGIVPTCIAHHGTSIILERLNDNNQPVIVKMSPREMFKFMGVSKEDIDKIEKEITSSTALFKMAANSIVVDVLYYIFKEMFIKL